MTINYSNYGGGVEGNDGEGQVYKVLDLDKIQKSFAVPAFIQNLAAKIQEKGLLRVGFWLKDLAYLDLKALSLSIESLLDGQVDPLESEDEVKFLCFPGMLVADLLAVGEGLLLSEDSEETGQRLVTLFHYISSECLKRKGIPVKLYYENMTLDFGEEDAPIIEFI